MDFLYRLYKNDLMFFFNDRSYTGAKLRRHINLPQSRSDDDFYQNATVFDQNTFTSVICLDVLVLTRADNICRNHSELQYMCLFYEKTTTSFLQSQ